MLIFTRTTAWRSNLAVCKTSYPKTISSGLSVSVVHTNIPRLMNYLTQFSISQSAAVTCERGSTLSSRSDVQTLFSPISASRQTTSRESVCSRFRLTWDSRLTGDSAGSISSRPTARHPSERTFQSSNLSKNAKTWTTYQYLFIINLHPTPKSSLE